MLTGFPRALWRSPRAERNPRVSLDPDPGPAEEVGHRPEALHLDEVHEGGEVTWRRRRGHAAGGEGGAQRGSINPTCPNSGGPESGIRLILPPPEHGEEEPGWALCQNGHSQILRLHVIYYNELHSMT